VAGRRDAREVFLEASGGIIVTQFLQIANAG
jgi:hypothetical protein